MYGPAEAGAARESMVARQVAARGVRDANVLAAMSKVPRDRFIAENLREFAYQDTPLPIESDQTISQPFIVGYMTEGLGLRGGERVLEIGTGSGYAAAVLAEIASEVYTVERYENLATSARERLERLGYRNVYVRHGDGSRGWPEQAPFDAIVVAAGGPEVPHSLRDQLAVGGRLVIPVGPREVQELLQVTRLSESDFDERVLTQVRFVPLVGDEGWELPRLAPAAVPKTVPQRIAADAEPFPTIEDADLLGLLERIGDSRLVLIGEASHGTSEFYRMRARISRELIEKMGFTIVAAEADWPDAKVIDNHVRQLGHPLTNEPPFGRFPTWMWRNEEVRAFVDWLAEHNDRSDSPAQRVGFFGLDLYSLYSSVEAVLRYLDEADPEAARVARVRYGCLTPYEGDPASYGYAALTRGYRLCEDPVVRILEDLLRKRLDLMGRDPERFVDAVQNAQLVVDAERYYRTMYYAGAASWNLRDQHMFDTLRTLLDWRGGDSKAVVWAHNSHLGDASATEMSARGEHNVGQLCRQTFGQDAYLIGFGTHEGTVAAATDWNAPMEIKTVQPAHARSYERVCHDTDVPRFLLPLHRSSTSREELMRERLERAIGVIYRPRTELASHYFQAILPRQFDEYIWFDRSEAVTPLPAERRYEGAPETYPFGL